MAGAFRAMSQLYFFPVLSQIMDPRAFFIKHPKHPIPPQSQLLGKPKLAVSSRSDPSKQA